MFQSDLVVIPGGHPQDVDPPKAPTETIFKQSEEFFLGKIVVIVLTYTTLSLVVLVFCTKDSAGLTLSLFLVCVVKEGSEIGWNCGLVSASSCCMSDKVKG